MTKPAALSLPVPRLSASWIGGGIVVLIALAAVFAPILGTVDPMAMSPLNRMKAPSADFWFGTDTYGRDLYSRVLYGGRTSLAVGFAVAILSTVAGLAIGLFAGYFRRVDGIVMRVMDGVMAIPAILLAIAFSALLGGSLGTVIVAISIAEIPRVARLIRGLVLSLRGRMYVEAAILAGVSQPRIIWRHILPNTLAPLIVQATYIFASAMLLEAILSFIGAGIPPTTPSWGNIISEGRAVWQIKFHIILYPAIFLSLAVFAINTFGDGLRDALDQRGMKHQ
ncbi:ABC transporter permease [Frigidibacter sp. MR17.24]|uniref:ABC transporter permease n=1 Tax=Frigidibacter sp. MR17.24 TaxID=3127345 RepID=UPI003012A6BD